MGGALDSPNWNASYKIIGEGYERQGKTKEKVQCKEN